MATTSDRVFEEALSLPVDVRLSLVERLLASLNLPIDEEIDRLWAEEAERRVSQIEEGKVKLVPGEEVFNRIRAKHGK
jgi:putative addiction module component (TIGR02574 family)